MDDFGGRPFGPFQEWDEVCEHWHTVKEKELEEVIEQQKKDLEDEDLQEWREDTEKIIKRASEELENLRRFVENHTRCLARFTHDKRMLQQITEDWHNYNESLWNDYAGMQKLKLGGFPSKEDKAGYGGIREEARNEEIIREEIEKRFMSLLK